MRLRRRNLIAAAVVVAVVVAGAAGYAGFRSAEPREYSPAEVREAFAAEGLELEPDVIPPTVDLEMKEFFSDRKGLHVWVVEGGPAGPEQGCDAGGLTRICLQRNNVGVVAPADRAARARAALARLD